MAQQHYLKAGLVNNYSGNQNPQAPIVGFHLERWLKRALKAYHVTTFDNCCDGPDSPQPLRYNPATGSVEAWDGTDWVAVTTGGTPLAPPTNFKGSQASGMTILTWDPVVGASGYILKKNGVTIYNGPLTTFTATGLTNGIPYTFTVVTKSTGNPNSAPATTIVTPMGLITPAPPTAPVVDDVLETFNWTNNPLYPLVTDYEQTLNGGVSYTPVAAKPIVVGPVAYGVGQVGVRVKAVAGVSHPSATVYNTVPFTIPPITAHWMSQLADPNADLIALTDPFVYTGSAVLAAVNSPIIIDVSNAVSYPDNYYIVVKVPATVNTKTLWTDDPINAPLNNGTIPDSLMRDMVSFGGFDYYYSRVPMIFDHNVASRVHFT